MGEGGVGGGKGVVQQKLMMGQSKWPIAKKTLNFGMHPQLIWIANAYCHERYIMYAFTPPRTLHGIM